MSVPISIHVGDLVPHEPLVDHGCPNSQSAFSLLPTFKICKSLACEFVFELPLSELIKGFLNLGHNFFFARSVPVQRVDGRAEVSDHGIKPLNSSRLLDILQLLVPVLKFGLQQINPLTLVRQTLLQVFNHCSLLLVLLPEQLLIFK